MRLVAASLILVLLGLLWPPASAHAASPATGDVYLALGNSLAVGYEAPGNTDGQPGYPTLLFERMRQMNPNLELVNTGVVGETSSTLLAGQLAQAEAAIATARSAGRCVGVITLDIGGNDFGRILTGETTPEVAIPTFQSNLQTILSRLRSAANTQVAGCSARIALMDYYNPYPGLNIPPSNQPLADMYLPQLNQIIRSTAAQYGVNVASVESAFTGREADLIYVNRGIYTNPLLAIPFTPWFAQNVDFHPRPAGHQVIAEQFWAVLGLVPPVPALEELPDLIPPTVALVAPWTCGECALAGRQQAALPALPEPQTINIEWLGAQLWNRITRPLLCWLLAMFQTGLNLYAATLNQIWIPALNQFYRMLYLLLFWLTSAFAAWWYLAEDMRQILWQINGAVQRQAQPALASVAKSDELAEAVLVAWVQVFSGALAPWSYLVSMYLQTVTQMGEIVVHLEEHRPEQLDQIANVWLFAAVVGSIRGVWESALGWWLVAQVALFWLGTALFLLDEAAEV